MAWKSTEMPAQTAAAALSLACFLNAAKNKGVSPAQVISERSFGNLTEADQNHKTAAANAVIIPIHLRASNMAPFIISLS
jgi:hypothetical protein